MRFADELKLAIINLDIDKLDKLSDIEFESENMEDLVEVATLMQEAIKLLEKERVKTGNSMTALRKLQKYSDTLQNKDSL
jgi:hypothetical protein